MSTYTCDYTERLTGQTFPKVPLAENRHQALSQFNWILSLADTDPEAFQLELRLATATDLYLLALCMSCSSRLDPFTSRREIDCDYLFDRAREWQFESENVVVTDFRGGWKSTFGAHVKPTQEILRNRNVTIALFSHQVQAAQRHLQRWMREIENNELLKTAWDDIFYTDPRRENDEGWSVEKGAVVKRSIVSISPTFGAYTFTKSLPTGSRFDIQIYDDCENESTVNTEAKRADLKEQFKNSMNLGGRGMPRAWVMGTFHHPDGILKYAIHDLGFRHRCHRAEDTDLPAPDIAALYDECDGVLPDGRELPVEVRRITLDGAPVYLHPLELARQRHLQGERIYNMQNMGNVMQGLQQRLRLEWISERYTGDPRDKGLDTNLYLLSDPSKGKGDPSVNLIFGVGEDGRALLLDATRAKLSPGEWNEDMFRLCRTWDLIGFPQQIRVEEYAQATWTFNLTTHFRTHRYDHEWQIIPCSNTASNKGERLREWMRLEPLFRQGKIILPEQLWIEDENGYRYDFIHYFVNEEYLQFPLLRTDDAVAAMSLLEEDKAGPLLPADPRQRRRGDEDDYYEGDREGDEHGWMTVGLV